MCTYRTCFIRLCLKFYFTHWRWLLFGCLLPTCSLAQLSVSSPVQRMVFQRSNANSAAVLVTGLAPPTATAVEARFVPLTPDQGQLTDWTSLAFLGDTKAFRGNVTVTAGWYRMDVRARNGNTVLNLTSVNRVGVGEVFVIAGQSNAVGGFEREPSAIEDRVSCLDFRQDELDEQLLPLRFSHVSYGSSIGPSQPPHIWGMLGDALVQRLGVPVLFLGAATAGTSSDQWRQSAAGNTVLQGQPYPYRRLGVVLQHYIARTGMRAVLWHQGEGDIGSSNDTYFNNLQYVIQKSRQQSGFSGLPWVVSRVTYTQGQTNPSVIAAQNRLISQVPNVYAGPLTDDLIGPDNRIDDNVHIGRNGLRRFADRWSESLSTAFFAQSTPFTPAVDASVLTSGYTLPLTRRPGETLLVPSLRSDGHTADSQYSVQLLRASDNVLISESAQTTANPIAFTLPANLPDGQYRFRTNASRPATTGTLSEVFTVNYFAQSTNPPTPVLPNVTGGTPDVALSRLGYRYELGVPAFYFMAETSTPVQCRVERIDGGDFSDSGWYNLPPASQGPDYGDFADYNYLRYYPPVSIGVGGVPPGRYRLSVRKQGDPGAGLWVETTLQNGRSTLYIAPDVVTVEQDQASKADLSLSAQLSNRAPMAGQPVMVTITVANSGPQPASGVMVSSILPPNLAFIDTAPAGVSVQSNVVTVNAGTLENGALKQFSFQVKADLPGRYLPALQITSSSAADPDSQPNSGTEDGQDDAVQLDLRTPDSGTAMFVSPNPNQTPLPPVQDNQPSTDPAKADLSLNMKASTLTPQPNQPVTLSLTVSNRGGALASNVSVATLLPPGWQLVNGAGLNANGQTIMGSLPGIAAGSQATLLLTVRITSAGVVKAQIQTATPADSDSVPGNGYDNGEDDETRVTMRTSN